MWLHFNIHNKFSDRQKQLQSGINIEYNSFSINYFSI